MSFVSEKKFVGLRVWESPTPFFLGRGARNETNGGFQSRADWLENLADGCLSATCSLQRETDSIYGAYTSYSTEEGNAFIPITDRAKHTKHTEAYLDRSIATTRGAYHACSQLPCTAKVHFEASLNTGPRHEYMDWARGTANARLGPLLVADIGEFAAIYRLASPETLPSALKSQDSVTEHHCELVAAKPQTSQTGRS